ncbi:MAG: heme exporter protein CcmB [Acidimicrobiia bacterium]|nr:heme exporter protein CcmB [Acidimicrobiia bacterium]MDH5505061.1 heme exporter protein CcmB [Acidimicrobiia bacterium]
MTFRRQALVIFRRDLRIEGRTGEALLITLPFGLAALFLIPLALPLDTELLSRIGPGMFWAVTLLFGMFITFRQSAGESPAQHEQLRMLGVDPAARYTGRVAASTLLLVVFEVVMAPTTILLFAPEPIPGWPWAIPLALLVAIGLALIGTLVSDMTASLRGRSTLAPLLVAPLSIPLLVPAAQGLESIRTNNGILVPALFMVLVVLALAVIGVMTAQPLEETT